MTKSVKFKELEIGDEFYISVAGRTIKAKKMAKRLAQMDIENRLPHIFEIDHLTMVQVIENA